VANDGSASVSVIDGTNDTVIATVTSTQLPYILAVDETTNRIYVTHTYSGSVTVIDGVSNTARELKVGDADGIALDPRTGTVFLSTYEDPSIRFVDEATGAVTKAIVGPHVWGIEFDQPSGTLFLTHTATAEIVALDEKTHAVSALSVGRIPCALAINPVTRRLYVVNYGDETLSILDLQTRTTIATLPVGPHPQGLAIDSKSNRIYVANVHGNSVTVIDGAKNAVVGVRTAGSYPYTIAVDQGSGRAYAANYGEPWVTPLPEVPPSTPPSPDE
jgi:YVTN family beta-propeller protein